MNGNYNNFGGGRMNGLVQKFVRFMYGRYGLDNLGKFILFFYFVMWIVNIFVQSVAVSIIMYLVLIYEIYRILSKKIAIRRNENEFYMKLRKPVAAFIQLQISRIRDRKTYVYNKCPKCRNVLRLPRKKGKHTVVCPVCKNRFGVMIFFDGKNQ